MPTEKADSKKILGDDFSFSEWSDAALCSESKCGYKTPTFPECIGGIADGEVAMPCWPCIVNTGCRVVGGSKCKKCETCQRFGGFNCCIAFAGAFPPDDKVPMGCGCCGIGSIGDVTLEGTGVDFKESTSCHTVCCCNHYACFTDFPACCGMHQTGECLFMTFLMHAALDPIEGCTSFNSERFCVKEQVMQCPKPCWPFCMYKDDACCC